MCRLLLPLHLDLTVKSKVFTSKRRFEHDYLTVYIRLAFFLGFYTFPPPMLFTTILVLFLMPICLNKWTGHNIHIHLFCQNCASYNKRSAGPHKCLSVELKIYLLTLLSTCEL